jgi:hypothetical protein
MATTFRLDKPAPYDQRLCEKIVFGIATVAGEDDTKKRRWRTIGADFGPALGSLYDLEDYQ